jgi:hypothetical protein
MHLQEDELCGAICKKIVTPLSHMISVNCVMSLLSLTSPLSSKYWCIHSTVNYKNIYRPVFNRKSNYNTKPDCYTVS